MKTTTILHIILFSILCNSCGSSSTKPYEGNLISRDIHFLDGLIKLEDGTTDKMAFDSNILFYTRDGILIPQLLVLKNTYSGDYVLHSLYVDKNNKLTLAIVAPITEENKKRRQLVDENKGKPSMLLGKDAVPFKVKDMDGNMYTQNPKENVIVLNFWFTACAPCVREIPELNKLVEKYKNKKVTFLAVANDKKEALIPFLEKHLFNYHVIPDGYTMSQDYQVFAAPTHVIIDKHAKIKYYYSGSFDSTSIKDFEQEIDEALIN